MDGFCQDDRYLYLILEYVSGGELFTYLRSVGRLESPHAWFLSLFYCLFTHFSNANPSFYAAQVTLMFEHLHSKNIIYR